MLINFLIVNLIFSEISPYKKQGENILWVATPYKETK
jgi:hypothetical protein